MIDLLWGNSLLAAGLLAFCLGLFQVSIYIIKKYKSSSMTDFHIFIKGYQRTLFIAEKKSAPIVAYFGAVTALFLCMEITGQTLPQDPYLHRYIVIFIIILSLIEFSGAFTLLVSSFLLVKNGETPVYYG